MMEHTREVLQKHNNIPGWIILISAIVFFVPSLLMQFIWLDLRSVHIPNVMEDTKPTVIADRVIRRDFTGTWAVEVRTAGKHEIFCLGKSPTSINYRKAASANNNPISMRLTEWMGVMFPKTCMPGGKLPEGEYYVTTCHTVHLSWYPLARRCVDSNVFFVDAYGPKPPGFTG